MLQVETRWIEKYSKAFELGFQTAMEYRINFLISLISAAYPILIQSFLWTAIFNQASGDEVYGFTYRQMMAYTFMAGLVGRIVRTGFEYEIMNDVKNGKFSTFLVQPIGYFPYRLCAFYGQKLPSMGMILAILAVLLVGLNAFWGLQVQLEQIVLFLLALALAVTLNFLIFYCFSAISFWIVEVGFLFEGIRIVTVLLSGGIFPLDVFGEQAQQLMHLLPFQYTVYFPINVLSGKLSTSEVIEGMMIQCAWIAATWLLSNLLWKIGNKRYVAVGG